MSKSGTWGDGLTLACAAAVYRRPITVVFNTGTSITISSPTSSPELPEATPISLGYIGKQDSLLKFHYVSLTSTGVISSTDRCSTNTYVTPQAVTAHDNSNVNSSNASSKACNSNTGQTPDIKQKLSQCNSHKLLSKRQSEYSWLVPAEGGALCSICSEYYSVHQLPPDHKGTFVTIPFNDWKKSTGSTLKNNKLLKHAYSDSHKTAVTLKHSGQTMTMHTRTVYSMLHVQSEEEKQNNVERLADFTDSAYFLFKNEIPHTTHYRPLLELVARLDGSHQIAKFMSSSPRNATYSSNDIVVEVLESVSDWLTSGLLKRVRSSPAISVMADESTDIRTRNELSVCLRFIENGQAVEAFLSLQQLQSTGAVEVKEAIKSFLVSNRIPMDKIVWLAFDGAANMSGRKNGVQALLRKDCVVNANYIHCRSHLLHLAAANVAESFKPLKALFAAFNSVWRFFHKSPKRHNCLIEMKQVINDPELELVQSGDTRWTSNYRAIKAIKISLRSLVLTLQHIHTESGDMSSEAGGLLLTFQNVTSILLIFAVEEILLPLNTLTLVLQSKRLSLSNLPEKVRNYVFLTSS
jgi:Domain of unknown function (DUF4371)